jgi:hypothetical protein
MKAYWGNRCIAPLILWLRHELDVSGELHAPAAWPQGNSPWYPLDRRLGGPQSRSGRRAEEEDSQPHRESNPRTPIVQPVAQRYTDWAITALPI